MATSFAPVLVSSTSISATGTSGAATLIGSAPQVRLYNSGSVTVFVRWGIGTQTAAVTDMALAPGAVECFTKQNATDIAAITGGTAATLYIISGTGD